MHSTSSDHQPRKARGKRWVIAVAILLALAIGGYFAAGKALERYLGSQDLLYRISEKTADMVRAPSGYLPLRWRGFSVSSDGLLARNEGGHSLIELRALHLHAHLNLSNLWQRRIGVEKLDVDIIEAAFSPDSAKHLVQNLPATPMLIAPAEGASSFNVHLAEVAVKKADILWGENGASEGGLREVTALFWPHQKNLVVVGYGGRFQQHGFPETRVSAFQLYYEKPVLRIDSGTLALGERGQIDVNGKFQFTKPGAMDLTLHFQHCPAGAFLGKEIQSKFEGTFKSETRIKQELGSDKEATAEGDISVDAGILKNVSALEKIATLTKEPRFRKLKLHELSAKFRWAAPKLSIEDFVAESKGLIRVEGEIQVNGETIHGNFQLGVSAEVLKSIPGAREEVFKKERDGYFWTPVKIEGPIKNPRENLKERLVAGAKKYYEKKFLAPFELILKPAREITDKLEDLF